MNSAQQLSPTAQKLYAILLNTGGDWEHKLTEILFDKPQYVSGTPNNEYWQWDANMYGHERTVKNDGDNWNTFRPNIDRSYADQTSDAYQQLRKAGLAGEKNNGYNDYVFYPLKRSA